MNRIKNASRVLIVEDDRALETVLNRVLESISPTLTVDWVTTAEEALTRVREASKAGRPYDLVIADIFLEGQRTGLEFWQQCQIACPGTAIVIMSSMPIDRFFTSIGTEIISPPYLQKPFRLGECKALFEGILRYEGVIGPKAA